MTKQTERFFNGAKDRQEGIVDSWTEIDIDKVFELAGVKNMNTDCMKECTGSDGQVYQQPVNRVQEKVTAAYLMGEFSLSTIPFTNRDLPFGIEIDGNWGARYIRTEVSGTGLFRFNSIVPNASGTQTIEYNRLVTLNRKSTDILPSFNSAVWLIPDQLNFRYNWAKTLARPPVNNLLPAGNCTINNTLGDEAEFSCGGRIGNPALEPQQNKNQNFAIEWYPNKDSMFSLAHFRQKGIVGASINALQTNSKLFGGTDITDPGTGRPLGNLSFSVPTYENGPPVARNGWELASKTAFTFLPSVLRYTGADLNYTKIKAVNLNSAVVDIISGDVLPVVNEPKHQYNLSLWYDDGALSARVALQVVAERFSCIAACTANTVNNTPAEGAFRTTVLPYNPGFPNYNSSTRYIDAKVAYKFKNGIELFADVRNLTKQTISGTQGKYGRFEDGTPSMLYYAYGGARVSAGVTFRFGGQ
jgi:TonB-dependent receptor